MIQPRDYQIEMANALTDYLCEHDGRPLCAAPTGTGKSLTINLFIRQSLESDPALRFLCCTHVKEIIGQNLQGMLDFWPRAPAGCYSAGLKQYDTRSSIIYCGIQSVFNKAEKFGKIDCLVVDEAHTISDKAESMWQKFIAKLKEINPDIRICGFTATAYRLSTGCLVEGGLFDKMVVDFTSTDRINRFVEEGYLCPLVSKKPSVTIDITNVAMKGGEFDPNELAEATDQDSLNRAVVDECIKYGMERNFWLVYATSVTHAQHLQERFHSKGVTCEVLTGEDNVERRTKLIGDRARNIEGDFQKGKFRALINVGVLTTGFDFKELDMIALVRATQSTGLYVQILGRGTRPHPSKANTLVLDFGRNIERLGAYNAPVIPKARRKGDDAAGEAPVKCCPNCSAYAHTRALVCPECGEEFPPPETIEAAASQAAVMVDSAQKPVIEIMQVKSTHYQDRPAKAPGCGPLVRVSYSDGFLHTVSEVFCPEPNPAFQWQRDVVFVKFWYAAGGKRPPPLTAAEFVERARGELKAPKQVYFESNVKHPKVTKREY